MVASDPTFGHAQPVFLVCAQYSRITFSFTRNFTRNFGAMWLKASYLKKLEPSTNLNPALKPIFAKTGYSLSL